MGETTTANLFDTLGIRAALGRTFLARDADGERVVVLSDPFWRQKFGGARSIIGQTVRMNDEPYRVIGILRRDFSYRILDYMAYCHNLWRGEDERWQSGWRWALIKESLSD